MQASFPIACDAIFISEILQNMKADEKRVPRPDHEEGSHYLQCRKVLVSWVIEVCEHMNLSNVTTFHACDLLDRVFMNTTLNQRSKRQSFQLVAMVCILVAAKYLETDDNLPSMVQLNELAANTYNIDLFRKVELSVLNFLEWRVTCITPLCYLKYYLAQTSTGIASIDQEVHRTVVLLLGLALQDHQFIKYFPSQLASAAILCARALVHQNSSLKHWSVWDERTEMVFGYTVEELEQCRLHLLQSHSQFMFLRAQTDRLTGHTNMRDEQKDMEIDEVTDVHVGTPPTPSLNATS